MRTRMLTVERLEEIARRGLIGRYATISSWDETRDKRHGGKLRRLVTLHLDMDCEQPVHAELHARHSDRAFKRVKPLTIVVKSRCRKCGPCRRRRTMFWQARAVDEWMAAPMTIFGTLTFRPDVDVMIDATARLELAERGVDFDRLEPADKFRTRVRYSGLLVTKWLKVIREGDVRRGKPNIRYLIVAEAHDSERTSADKRHRPHYHVLLNEQTKDQRLVLPDEWAANDAGEVATDKYGNPYLTDTAFLKSKWGNGHSSFALCRSPQAAAYLCKYLTKEETRTRIRASFRYGTRNENGAEAERCSSGGQPERAIQPYPALPPGTSNSGVQTKQSECREAQ